MTRVEFIARAIKEAERAIGFPSGWWGRWRDATNGTGRVHWSGRVWFISWRSGKRISRHDSKVSAIRKASKL